MTWKSLSSILLNMLSFVKSKGYITGQKFYVLDKKNTNKFNTTLL
jgi:hypothetical protein